MRGAAYLDASQAKRESVQKVFVFGDKRTIKIVGFSFFSFQIEDVDLRAQTLQGLIALMIKI